MPKPIQTYRDLAAWQSAMDLCQTCIALGAKLSVARQYALADQLMRAAVSVPSNIAEGHGHSGSKAFAHHCAIANGSLNEVETLLEIALRATLMLPADCEAALRQAEVVGAKLIPLISSLRRAAKRTTGKRA